MRYWRGSVLVVACLLLLPMAVLEVRADGTEMLGPPSVTIERGSGVLVAGVGLRDSQPAALTFDVPAGNEVAQVLLYWEGQMTDNSPGDDTIMVNGTEITGVLIGGPTEFFADAWSSSYRADISDDFTWIPGLNTLQVGGLDFTRRNNGAGVMVIIDDGVNVADIEIADGNDLAFINFMPPLNTTVAQIFSFDPSVSERSGELFVLASASRSTDRPDVIEIESGALTTQLCNELNGDDGADFDSVAVSAPIPAGATSASAQLLSQDCDPPIGGLPESFAWMVVAFSLDVVDLACRMTGGGHDEDFNWDGTFEEGEDPDGNFYTFGGEAGARTAQQPQPSGEWTHTQHKGPAGSFTFHAGTASAPVFTEVDWITCNDPFNCVPARPAPAKQLDFAGVGTFKNLGKGSKAPEWLIPGANVSGGRGNKEFNGTYHWFEVNVDDLGEPGNKNTTPIELCPAEGFGRNGSPVVPADCGCPDFYRITIYDGVYPDPVTGMITPNKDDVIYQVRGYVDGGNLQIHPPTGFDK